MKEKKQNRRAGKPAAKPEAMPPKTEAAAKPAPAMTVDDKDAPAFDAHRGRVPGRVPMRQELGRGSPDTASA